MEQQILSFDIEGIKERVKKTLLQSNDPEGGREIFMEEIMDWTDYYTENFLTSENISNLNNTNKQIAFDAIITLWLEFAQFEINLRQFKKAVELFDKALNDPIVNRANIIYIKYAEYCVERGKNINAQKVYIKAFSCSPPLLNTDELWINFLNLMHRINSSNNLTLEELVSAVKTQLSDPSILVPPSSLNNNNYNTEIINNTSDTKKDIHQSIIESKEESNLEINNDPQVNSTNEEIINNQIHDNSNNSNNNNIQENNISIPIGDDFDNSFYGMTPELLIKTFNQRPPMIFTATNKEPMISGFKLLNSNEILALESFLEIPLANICNNLGDNNNNKLDFCLDLLEAMWSTQSLKERHFDSWMSDLNAIHLREEKELNQTLFSRKNVFEINENIENEIRKFQNRCAVQKELLNALINKTMFLLLLDQQKALANIGFPKFSQNFIEKLESSLNNRKININDSNTSDYDDFVVNTISEQRQLVCALISYRLNAIADERNKLNKSKLLVAPALFPDNSNDDLDYYSLEAKKKRRKRRLISHQNNNDSSYSNTPINSYNSHSISNDSSNEYLDNNIHNQIHSDDLNYNRYSSINVNISQIPLPPQLTIPTFPESSTGVYANNNFAHVDFLNQDPNMMHN